MRRDVSRRKKEEEEEEEFILVGRYGKQIIK